MRLRVERLTLAPPVRVAQLTLPLHTRGGTPPQHKTHVRSLLSIINKFAILHFPFPAALTGFQYTVSAAAVIFLCVHRHVPPAPRASRTGTLLPV